MKMCLSPFCNENMSVESKIESRIQQKKGTEPMIGVQCKNKMIMIDEHIPKHQVSVNKMKGCVEPRQEDENPEEKTC